MKIVILDYGMGNIKSITSALKYIGIQDILLSSNIDDISNADKLILPGVGSFSKAMQNLKALELDKILQQEIQENKKPILGICLGMQLLVDSSTEDGKCSGLGFIPGNVTKFKFKNLKIPHVGFNQVNFTESSRLYNGLKQSSDFYFTHSYQMQSTYNINQSTCTYGNQFIVSYEVENIAGVQFHPELSQTNGLKLLKNFIENF